MFCLGDPEPFDNADCDVIEWLWGERLLWIGSV
jgi:hypothetical protein